jgi:hypothetical protein
MLSSISSNRARHLANPLDLLADGRGQAVRRVVRHRAARGRHGLKPDDIGLAGRDRQHALAGGADQDGRMRALHRLGKAVERRDHVVLAGERERARAEEPLEHVERLLEAVDPHTRRIEGHPRGVVLGLREAGPETELDASAREHVERRDLLGEHDGMPVVVREDEAPDAQPRRRGGHRRERRQRGQLIPERLLDEVIADQEGRVARALGPPGRLEQGVA